VPADLKILTRFLSSDPDAPVVLLNLLRFSDKASYPDGHKDEASGRSGRQAYRHYHLLVDPIFLKLGTNLAFASHYPTRRIVAALFTNPRYLEEGHHRSSELLDY